MITFAFCLSYLPTDVILCATQDENLRGVARGRFWSSRVLRSSWSVVRPGDAVLDLEVGLYYGCTALGRELTTYKHWLPDVTGRGTRATAPSDGNERVGLSGGERAAKEHEVQRLFAFRTG
ncbi:hypothetical protein BD626DRAFT_474093 [Schizophyllum amplum]|uniref:Uncharacterized protein n=1 Tax=Schizophyllum amplum TaxID=97359 RepID=A0A550CXC6_9AGAR|nr:hypothetical protein BD626DRAFT_474093 [Auriculariopsis ampla]